jgi:hypothetical protein
MILREGDNPALGHCRICGRIDVPPYEGYYRDGVCSRECSDEYQWRSTLRTLRKPYSLQPTKPTPEAT